MDETGMDEYTPLVEEIPTGHEPHHQALSRTVVAGVAIACVIGVGIIWSRWGEDIKRACTGGGDEGACAIELPADPVAPPTTP